MTSPVTHAEKAAAVSAASKQWSPVPGEPGFYMRRTRKGLVIQFFNPGEGPRPADQS